MCGARKQENVEAEQVSRGWAGVAFERSVDEKYFALKASVVAFSKRAPKKAAG